MNKRGATALVFVSLIAFLFLIFQSVNLARANFIPPPTPNTDPPALEVQSPQNGTTCTVNSVTLNFTVTKPDTWIKNTQIHGVWYTLDGNGYSMLFTGTDLNNLDLLNGDGLQKTTNYLLTLSNVSNGAHSLDLHVTAVSQYSGQSASGFHIASMEVIDNLYFDVEAPVPTVSNLSIENKTYSSTEIPLSFNINGSASEITYSIDNKANVTINGNATLTDLVDGSHSIVVHVRDSAGNVGSSDVVFFTINTQPSPSPSPTPSTTPSPSISTAHSPFTDNPSSPFDPVDLTPYYLIVGAAASAIIIIAVIVYFRKRTK